MLNSIKEKLLKLLLDKNLMTAEEAGYWFIHRHNGQILQRINWQIESASSLGYRKTVFTDMTSYGITLIRVPDIKQILDMYGYRTELGESIVKKKKYPHVIAYW